MPRRQHRQLDRELEREVQFESDGGGQITDDFDKMELKKDLLRGIYSYGLEKPAPVQQRAIVPLLNGRNLIMQAQSGTGKTGAFVIAILQKLDMALNVPQALIIVPTHELALQIHKVILAIGKYMHVKCHTCIGGRKVSKDIQELAKGVHIVVGTPGRLHHMIREGALVIDKIKTLCLDEADEMLSRGFKVQIVRVMDRLPTDDLQVILLSATIPPDSFRDMTKGIMSEDPVKILVKKEQLTLEGIQQFFIAMDSETWKLDTLCDLYNNETFTFPTVVFRNTRKEVDQLVTALEERELTASATHGGKAQSDRETYLRSFRKGESRVIITTDMLSRGIDVQQVAVVVNYDLPQDKGIYMHRIGRSGRFGRKGIAINFVTPADIPMLRAIEEYYSTQIEEMPQFDLSSLLSRISLDD